MPNDRLRPFLQSLTTVKLWLSTHPPEKDIFTAVRMERCGQKRKSVLARLLTRGQRLQRNRECGGYR